MGIFPPSVCIKNKQTPKFHLILSTQFNPLTRLFVCRYLLSFFCARNQGQWIQRNSVVTWGGVSQSWIQTWFIFYKNKKCQSRSKRDFIFWNMKWNTVDAVIITRFTIKIVIDFYMERFVLLFLPAFSTS